MPVKSYREDFLLRLADSNYASEYLNVALDEALQEGNMETFRFALKNVVDANYNLREVASESELDRQHLHRLLRAMVNPTIEILAFVLDELGLSLDFTPKKDSNNNLTPQL